MGYAMWCSGVLIHERVFLTAGHCINYLFFANLINEEGCPIDRTTRPGPGVWVSFDYDPDLTNPGTENKCDSCLDVERVLIHPDFAKRVDIGVIILKDKTVLEPIALPTEGLLDELKDLQLLKDAEFLAVGYGVTDYNSPAEELEFPDQRKVCFADCANWEMYTYDQVASLTTHSNSTPIIWHTSLSTQGFLPWP